MTNDAATSFTTASGDGRTSDSRLRLLFESNVVGIVIARNDGTIVETNDAFLAMLGYTRADFEAGRLDWRRVTPSEWEHADERAIDELGRTGIFASYQKEYVRKDGTRVPISVGGVRVAGTNDEQVCYVIDLTDQKATEAALRSSELRYRILAEGLPQVVMLADAQRRPVYVNRYYEELTGITSAEIGTRWAEAIHPDDLPGIVRARATGGAYDVEYRLRRASDGAYIWHYARCMEIPGDSRDARWLAAAIDIDDRKRAEDALRFIERASERLSQSLDLETTFDVLLDLVVPEFGDWAAIALRGDDGKVRTAVARHKDPAKAHLTERIRGVNYYKPGATPWGTSAVYVTATPQLLTDATADDLRAAVREEYVDTFIELGVGSLVALPIFAGDEVIGSFGIVSAGDSRRYTASDLPALGELARRAGFAIANGRKYEREHRVASILQEAALPRKLPDVPGFTFDGYYRAGKHEALIGGDWYDAHVVSGGRIVISVGDVAGSGLEAAVLMSTVRQLLRGAAHVYADPMLMLEIADRALRAEREDAIVTAFVGVIDPVGKTLLYGSAGHYPALLRDADGSITELHTSGLPLGCRGLAASESRTAVLPAGSCLMLYTDGLVEQTHNVIAGEALLRERLAESTCDSPRAAQSLVERVLEDAPAQDDVAVLMVGIG